MASRHATAGRSPSSGLRLYRTVPAGPGSMSALPRIVYGFCVKCRAPSRFPHDCHHRPGHWGVRTDRQALRPDIARQGTNRRRDEYAYRRHRRGREEAVHWPAPWAAGSGLHRPAGSGSGARADPDPSARSHRPPRRNRLAAVIPQSRTGPKRQRGWYREPWQPPRRCPMPRYS